jgi:hypothetical protein
VRRRGATHPSPTFGEATSCFFSLKKLPIMVAHRTSR